MVFGDEIIYIERVGFLNCLKGGLLSMKVISGDRFIYMGRVGVLNYLQGGVLSHEDGLW